MAAALVLGVWGVVRTGLAQSNAPVPPAPASQPCRPDLLAPLPVADGESRILQRELGAKAEILETDHFLIASDAGGDSVRALAGRLEAVYRAHVRFADDLGLPVHRPEHKLEVLYFASYSTFRAYVSGQGAAAAETVGCYLPQAGRAVFFDFASYPPVEQLRAQCEQEPGVRGGELRRRLKQRQAMLWLSVVQHEAAHEIQLQLGVLPAGEGVPTWLYEGLAMLFEVPFDAADVALGRANGYRLYEYRRLYGQDAPAGARWRRLLTDDEAWCGGPCYSLAWAVTAYLYDEHRAKFGELLRRLDKKHLAGRRSARLEELESLFGPLDAAWAQRLRAWVQSLPLPAGWGAALGTD